MSKSVQVNLYITYGIKIDISTANQTMKRFNEYPDIYSFIYANGLEYTVLEENQHPTGYIIGKVLNYSLNFVSSEIEIKDNEIYIISGDKKTKLGLSRQEEIEINNKLYHLGFPPFTKYYISQNFYKHY